MPDDFLWTPWQLHAVDILPCLQRRFAHQVLAYPTYRDSPRNRGCRKLRLDLCAERVVDSRPCGGRSRVRALWEELYAAAIPRGDGMVVEEDVVRVMLFRVFHSEAHVINVSTEHISLRWKLAHICESNTPCAEMCLERWRS